MDKRKVLNEDEVIKIRRILHGGFTPHSDIAEVFGVSKATIGRINRWESWKTTGLEFRPVMARKGN